MPATPAGISTASDSAQTRTTGATTRVPARDADPEHEGVLRTDRDDERQAGGEAGERGEESGGHS